MWGGVEETRQLTLLRGAVMFSSYTKHSILQPSELNPEDVQ